MARNIMKKRDTLMRMLTMMRLTMTRMLTRSNRRCSLSNKMIITQCTNNAAFIPETLFTLLMITLVQPIIVSFQVDKNHQQLSVVNNRYREHSTSHMIVLHIITTDLSIK